jgi:hypothetical protein
MRDAIEVQLRQFQTCGSTAARIELRSHTGNINAPQMPMRSTM